MIHGRDAQDVFRPYTISQEKLLESHEGAWESRDGDWDDNNIFVVGDDGGRVGFDRDLRIQIQEPESSLVGANPSLPLPTVSP